ncbi:uncharacterized protein F4807DRAFT_378697 [Annulohypoxylon truncatum]|uniref:uncharacterized protein n=1 Tax=Annulohypoxylon truncatum TaxID=327061 RepID=UPI0020071E8E|nr:uncharacterized protein F4807DRAFT_378697 [Annulohypoxylon truncatum]KAI1211837.1 hypothetical protein F4807DRAFT_378697 [Annulohypoxylon truncatum]
MKCQGAVGLPLLAALVAGVMAGDLMEDLRRDLELDLFARQQPITNFQRFTSALGSKPAAQIVSNDDADDAKNNPFKITNSQRSNGDTFTDFNTAANRVCDDQKNDCADVANGGGATFKVSDCDTQDNQCKQANTPTDQDDQFLYFCD